MKTLQELQVLILQWAKDKDLLKLENAPKQRLKLLEEVGETAGAILKNKTDEIKDGIGDIFVVLVILAEQLDSSLDLELTTKELTNFLVVDFNIGSIIYFSFDEDFINSFHSLVYTSNSLNLDLTECANLAWNEIKDRKGNTINGVFIKNQQLDK